MNELRERDEWGDDCPQTDSMCPWCKEANLRQGAEVRFCPDCPFSAMYHSELQRNPAYIIEAFAEFQRGRYENRVQGQ